MANFAVLQNNIVVNIIDAPSLQIAQEVTLSGNVCIEYVQGVDAPSIGWIYDEEKEVFLNP
jgi:hypothetical protein